MQTIQRKKKNKKILLSELSTLRNKKASLGHWGIAYCHHLTELFIKLAIFTHLFISIIHVYTDVDCTDFSRLYVSQFASLPLSACLFLHINFSRLFWLGKFNWYFPWSVNRINFYTRKNNDKCIHTPFFVSQEVKEKYLLFIRCILMCSCAIISCSIYTEGEAGTTPNSSPKIQFEKIVRKMRYMFQISFDGFLGI